VATLTDGRTFEGDVLVGADGRGLHSSTFQLILSHL